MAKARQVPRENNICAHSKNARIGIDAILSLSMLLMMASAKACCSDRIYQSKRAIIYQHYHRGQI